ncbi:MAG: acetylxylan esterase [Cryobacterium sp.]|nr:acetylxylan esterase [Cryobacterium sp.]
MFVDSPEAELRHYVSSQSDPADFDSFWEQTLAEAREYDLGLMVRPVQTPLETIEIFDITFNGYGGQPIKAWLRVPAAATAPLPVIVEYVGYGGGRGHALEDLLWSSAGYAHLIMDNRGQGTVWKLGDTPDDGPAGPQAPGMMTRGIRSPETYYFRRLFTDAVRAVEAARALDAVDSSRVALHGISQGGGIALAVSALVPDVAVVMPRVPFLCDFPRATVITDELPYREIAQYLSRHRSDLTRAHETLAYFDGVNFARRAVAPARFSTALMDPVCPPSTVFAAYNAYAGEKTIDVWPYNAHEGGGIDDDVAVLGVLERLWGTATVRA